MYTILLVDNDADFLDTRREYLENAGHRVLTADSLEQARKKLADEFVHLALLDIRMVDDDDDRDTSGLTLAKDPAYRSVPKIMLTGFPTYQAVREALGPALDGLPPAVAFLAKQEGPAAMIDGVNQVLATHVRSNRDLLIQWDAHQGLSFVYLISLLQSGLPDESLPQRADELEDLFRRLFRDDVQIRIPTLFWHGGERFCLPVLIQSSEAAVDARIVVCGQRESLEQEMRQVRGLAPVTLRGLRLDRTAETPHLAATAFALPDANLETFRPLRALFQEGRERVLKAALQDLLAHVLPAWHQRGQEVQAGDLMGLFRRRAGLGEEDPPRAEVERRVDVILQASRLLGALEIERQEGSILFRFPNESPEIFPDPVARAYSPLPEIPGPIVCRISPGLLTADNILVDGDQHVWLTDFSGAGQSPQWWDFVCLEALLRFDLSQAPDFLAWHEFEESLVQPAQLHDDLDRGVAAGLRTTVSLIEPIRRQAGSETGPDVLPYYAGLLAWTVGALARHDPDAFLIHEEKMRGAHLLLSACLLARRIDELIHERQQAPVSPIPREKQTATRALRLDKDGIQVWIGPDRAVALTGQERELFLCLYERAGRVVPRKTIVERVLKQTYEPGDEAQENSLNSLVRRLRQKIEPDPGQPRHLLGTRSQGYRLETGEPTAS